jgi:hypothetical protein
MIKVIQALDVNPAHEVCFLEKTSGRVDGGGKILQQKNVACIKKFFDRRR